MSGILDILRAAAGPVAGARAGFLEGQEAGNERNAATARQSQLDEMKRKVDESAIAENASRAKYWSSFADQKATPTDDWTQAVGVDDPTIFNKKTGISAPLGVSGKAPKVENVKDPNVYDPSTGTVSDITVSGKRVNTRPATAIEKMKYNHMPRDPGDTPLKPEQNEAYLNTVADRAIQASNGDVAKAAAMVTQDPQGLKAYKSGLATRHFLAAKQRFQRQAAIDADVHDINSDGSAVTRAPVGGGRAGAGGTTPPKSPSGPSDLTDEQILEAMNSGAQTPDDVVSYWKNKKP